MGIVRVVYDSERAYLSFCPLVLEEWRTEQY